MDHQLGREKYKMCRHIARRCTRVINRTEFHHVHSRGKTLAQESKAYCYASYQLPKAVTPGQLLRISCSALPVSKLRWKIRRLLYRLMHRCCFRWPKRCGRLSPPRIMQRQSSRRIIRIHLRCGQRWHPTTQQENSRRTALIPNEEREEGCNA